MAEPNTEREVRCTYCASPLISTRARMCPVCKSWQSRWKNNLVFFGGSAGVLALLFTAATYVSTTIYTALSQRQDAQVLQFQYPGHQIVDNSGTVPLMLSHYEFVWHSGKKPPMNAVVTIGEELPPRKVFSHKDDATVFKDRLAPEGFIANPNGDGTPFLSNASPEYDKCYLMVFFAEDAPELKYLDSFFKQSNVKLATVKIDRATLFYYSIDDPTRSPSPKDFDAVAAFLKLRNQKSCPETTKTAQVDGKR